jgi:hypothetical protein
MNIYFFIIVFFNYFLKSSNYLPPRLPPPPDDLPPPLLPPKLPPEFPELLSIMGRDGVYPSLLLGEDVLVGLALLVRVGLFSLLY